MITETSQKIVDTFYLVREDKRIGNGTESYVDLCATDRELFEEISLYYRLKPQATPQEFLEYAVEMDALQSQE